jgi:hypothetical protein
MLRLPNPGSDIRSFIRIFQVLYEELEAQPTLTLDDISRVLVQRNLASSSGFVGEKALELSNSRKTNQLKPLYNQSKMYSELFRVLGWIHPDPNNRLIGHFTYLGMHAAAAVDPTVVFQEGVLGIAYPNPHVEAKGGYVLRPFACILRTMAALGGALCRDEMIVGPLSLNNDRSEANFSAMVESINRLRGDWRRLSIALGEAASRRRIAINTMRNYTRFPIGVLEWCGSATKERIRDIYGKPMVFQVLTSEGRDQLQRISSAVDVRASDLTDLPTAIKSAFIRLTFYQMLARAGFDTGPVQAAVAADTKVLVRHGKTASWVGGGREMIFSPFQELDSRTLEPCFLTVKRTTQRATSTGQRSTASTARAGAAPSTPGQTQVALRQTPAPQAAAKAGRGLAEEIRRLYQQHKRKAGPVVAALVKKYEKANRDTFYPLVAELFQLVGYDCEHTRAGVNYERWDALIQDTEQSIPIEIKSPGEELFISVKAVRQALENKIVLLARKQVPTRQEVTSLAVGYNPPHDRSEVTSLIQDINKTFGIKIGANRRIIVELFPTVHRRA